MALVRWQAAPVCGLLCRIEFYVVAACGIPKPDELYIHRPRELLLQGSAIVFEKGSGKPWVMAVAHGMTVA